MTKTTRTIPTIIDNDPYFQWLCKKVGVGKGKPYLRMTTLLHQLIFRPSIEMDGNRANDGLMLRVEFMQRYGEYGSSTNRGACTMLEFLIGLAKRMSFLMGEEGQPSKTEHYFWCLIRNLRLLKLTDERYDDLNGDFFVEEAVQRVLDRSYDAYGNGGLFPLRYAVNGYMEADIWYQMQAWLGEHCEINID